MGGRVHHSKFGFVGYKEYGLQAPGKVMDLVINMQRARRFREELELVERASDEELEALGWVSCL